MYVHVHILLHYNNCINFHFPQTLLRIFDELLGRDDEEWRTAMMVGTAHHVCIRTCTYVCMCVHVHNYYGHNYCANP